MNTVISPEYQAKHDYSQGYDNNPYPVGTEEHAIYAMQMAQLNDQEDLWAYQ
jgi:hypothetical protein